MSRKITTLMLAALIAAGSITASYAEQAKEEPQKIASIRCADKTYDGSGSTREVKNQQTPDRSQGGSAPRRSPDNTPRPELGHVGY